MTQTMTPPIRSIEPEAAAPATMADRLYRLSIERYNRLIESGVFSENDPIFLWKGQLVTKTTKNPPHTTAQLKLDRLLTRLVPDGWHVRPEKPVAFSDASLPEPDVAIVRGTIDDYAHHHPVAADVALVVEVADSSLAVDRTEMLQGYAAQSIPIYLIVNLPDRRLELYTEPTGPGDPPCYRSTRFFTLDENLPLTLDGREVGRINVRDVLP